MMVMALAVIDKASHANSNTAGRRVRMDLLLGMGNAPLPWDQQSQPKTLSNLIAISLRESIASSKRTRPG
jgi:hypothetical protein